MSNRNRCVHAGGEHCRAGGPIGPASIWPDGKGGRGAAAAGTAGDALDERQGTNDDPIHSYHHAIAL